MTPPEPLDVHADITFEHTRDRGGDYMVAMVRQGGQTETVRVSWAQAFDVASTEEYEALVARLIRTALARIAVRRGFVR